MTQTVSVTFTATAPQVDNSTVSANPHDVAADGKTSSTVTVTLDDHNSNPVSGKTIALAAAGGSSVITPVSPTTNAQGQATFGVTDSTSEVVLYTATDTTDNLVLAGQGATVTFGTPSPVVPAVADSTMVAEPITGTGGRIDIGDDHGCAGRRRWQRLVGQDGGPQSVERRFVGDDGQWHHRCQR